MGIIKQLREYKKWKKERAKLAASDNELFLNSFNNFDLWQKVIQECNKNEDLKVTMRLADGTSVEFKTTKREAFNYGRPSFTGNE